MAEIEVVSPTEPKTFWMSEIKAKEIGAVQVTSIELPAVTPDAVPEVDVSHDGTALKILRIIEKYGLNYERTGSWEGFNAFLPIVKGQVERDESVKILLPGFPFKSPSKGKVLGALPDLGEELALKHLNGLCENIKAVYNHGAEVHITSDGLVYNDCLGVSDEVVWDYGEAVRQMAGEHDLHHLHFIRLWDLLKTPGSWSKDY
ncbi:Pyoverdine/dityrosine biosynthesis protein-domain-containing protein, partial [Pyrenochaeta sp. MPI-SDFR-AT-0127]